MPCASARRFPGLRAAVLRGGGRSSLLRLTSSSSRLPTAVALGDWVGRVMRPQGDEAEAKLTAPIVARRWPDPAANAPGRNVA